MKGLIPSADDEECQTTAATGASVDIRREWPEALLTGPTDGPPSKTEMVNIWRQYGTER